MDRTNAPGHVNHLFVAEDPATNRPPTEFVPTDFNAWQEELISIILAAQIVPSAANNAQVLEALNAMFAKINGATGLIRTLTPAGGARIRELGDIANAATVGGIEFGISYNCNIDPVTGVWAGRDVTDICWLEKWSDVGGVKEYWYAPTAAAGVVPVWQRVEALDLINAIRTLTGSLVVSGNVSMAAATLAAHGVNLGQFTGGNQSLASSGYQKLPGGLIIQWGVTSVVTGNLNYTNTPITFPITFPNAALSIVAGVNIGSGNSGQIVCPSAQIINNSSGNILWQSYGTVAAQVFGCWFAIGK